MTANNLNQPFPSTSSPAAPPLGPGNPIVAPPPQSAVNSARLVYVMGALDADNAKLLHYAHQQLVTQKSITFAPSYTTCPIRGINDGNCITLSKSDFEQQKSQNQFILTWEFDGQSYGIGAEIDIWLNNGMVVVVRGPHLHFRAVCQRYPRLQPVLVSAPSGAALESFDARLTRLTNDVLLSKVSHPRLVAIDNSGDALQSGEHFINLVKQKTSPDQ